MSKKSPPVSASPLSTINWTPKRRGKYYCSSACGGKCLYADFLSAKQRSEKLLQAVQAFDNTHRRDWIPEVTENLGWYAGIRHRELDFTIHPAANSASDSIHMIINTGVRSYTVYCASVEIGLRLLRIDISGDMDSLMAARDVVDITRSRLKTKK